jgi:hypothetical protein
MNVSRRSFLAALFAGAPAVVLAAPGVARLLATAEAKPPAGPRKLSWAEFGDYPAGRNLIAEVVADDGRHAVLMKVGLACQGPGVATVFVEFAEPRVIVQAQRMVGTPPGVIPSATVLDMGGRIVVPPGGRLQLWADLPVAGSAAGYLFCDWVKLD